MKFTWTPLVDDSVPGAHDGTPTAAAPLNALAAKVGDDASAVTTSLDYLLKNPASLEPGHKHNVFWSNDGTTELLISDGFNQLHAVGQPGGAYFVLINSNPTVGEGFVVGADLDTKFFNVGYQNEEWWDNSSILQLNSAGMFNTGSGAVGGLNFVSLAGPIRFATGGDAFTDVRFFIDLAGSIGMGTVSPVISDGIGLHIAGKILRLGTPKTPATSGASGNKGETCWDSGFLYICVDTNSWKKVAIAGLVKEIGMDLTTYSVAKAAGQAAVAKLNDAYILSVKRFDPTSGQSKTPQVQAVGKAKVQAQIHSLQGQVASLMELLADLEALG